MISAPEPPRIFVSLGSNIDPETNLVRAVHLLSGQCAMVRISSAYRTPPQGFAAQADFINMAVEIRAEMLPLELKLQVLEPIERELGRQRDPANKNAPRTIDLDISLWGDSVLEYGSKPWRLPDPDIVRYAYVAVPLAELAPDFLHPTENVTLLSIAARFEPLTFTRFSLLTRE